MRDVELGTESRQGCGVFRSRDHVGRAAEERPPARERIKKGGAVFETRAAYESDRRRSGALRQVGKSAREVVGIRSLVQGSANDPHGMRMAARVDVAEEVGHERPVAGFARKLRRRAAG